MHIQISRSFFNIFFQIWSSSTNKMPSSSKLWIQLALVGNIYSAPTTPKTFEIHLDSRSVNVLHRSKCFLGYNWIWNGIHPLRSSITVLPKGPNKSLHSIPFYTNCYHISHSSLYIRMNCTANQFKHAGLWYREMWYDLGNPGSNWIKMNTYLYTYTFFLVTVMF